MKSSVSIAISSALLVTVRLAAAEGIAPPAGWEVPPVATGSPDKAAKPKKKQMGPACCAFDSTCCSRQADIDASAKPKTIQRSIEIKFAELPEATIREVAEGGTLLEDVPPVRLLNEGGQPYPWPKAPREIRMVPPGPLGAIAWNDGWLSPSFEEKELQSLGWGTIHYVDDKKPYFADAEITGKVEYTSIRQGDGDKLIFDIAKGKVSGSPNVKGTYHLHVEAAHVVDKVVHAYRSTTKTEKAMTTWVNFLLPQVIEGFESMDAKHEGGFFPSRFSRSWSYSLYRLPYGPGLTNMATFRLDDDDKRRWIGVSKQRPPKIFMRHVFVTTSQTSAEKEPRTYVMFFDEFSFN